MLIVWAVVVKANPWSGWKQFVVHNISVMCFYGGVKRRFDFADVWRFEVGDNFVKTYNVKKISAGLLMYRVRDGQLQVLLVHPGGPFFQNKDYGVWSIPKGEIEPGEEMLTAAQREFTEETGIKPNPPYIELGQIIQKSGKKVYAWACAGDCEPQQARSNTFRMEWPPRSGHWQAFPEVDRAEWFSLPEARRRIKPAQLPLLDRLVAILQPKQC